MNNNRSTIAIVFINNSAAELSTLVEILHEEFEKRGIKQICTVTEDDLGEIVDPQKKADAIIKALELKEFFPVWKKRGGVYSQEEEEKIKKRLEDLGYI